MCDWRAPLPHKFSKLLGIRSLHDFIYVTHPVTSNVVARMRKLCYSGPFKNSTGHVLQSRDSADIAIPNHDSSNYARLRMIKALSDSKIKHLQQMYRDFIPSDRYLNFLFV